MRILHITPDYHPTPGGGELYVKEISERLAARGHDVTVLAMNSRGAVVPGGDSFPSRETVNGVRVRRLNNSYRVHRRILAVRGAHRALAMAFGADQTAMLSVSPWSPRALWLTLRARADIVAVFNWYHASLAHQTALARSVGEFAFVGVPFFHTERPWARAPLLARTLARCDAVMVMTDHERQFVEAGSGRTTTHVVGAGVDPTAFAAADDRAVRARYGLGEGPVVGYVGRVAAAKGVRLLLAAMTRVWRDDPSVCVLLAGSGLAHGERLDEEVRAALDSLSDAQRARVVAVGPFKDAEKPGLFRALDVFVMPSIAESFGIAYLEAWMCRKAVIGSRIGATQCVIRDGVDGVLVDPGAPDELADAILRLLRDRASREALGAAGHERTMAQFTWERVVDRVEAAYLAAKAERHAAQARAVA